MKLTEAQKEYIKSLTKKGAFFVPTNKNKAPVAPSGYNEVKNKPSFESLIRVLENRAEGLGLISGELGFHTIDFDLYKVDGASDTFEAYKDLVKKSCEGLWAKLYLERTKSGGFHLIYRSGKTEKTQELAHKLVKNQDGEEKYECIIEFRGVSDAGNGSYAVIAPTEGYTQISENSLLDIPMLKDSEVEELLACARYFDEKPKPVKDFKRSKKGGHSSKKYNDRSTPWGDYNNMTNYSTFEDMLSRHDWKYFRTAKGGREIHFTRPGKKQGTSAVLYTDKNHFRVFSSSTKDFSQNSTQSLSITYAILEHGGTSKKQLSNAAKALFREGFGTRGNETQEELKQKEKEFIDFIEAEQDEDDLLCEYTEEIYEAKNKAAILEMQNSKTLHTTMLPQQPILDATFADFPEIFKTLFSDLKAGHSRDFALLSVISACTGVLSDFYHTVYGDEKKQVNILNFYGVGKSASGKGIAPKAIHGLFSKVFTEIRKREYEEKKSIEEEIAKYQVAKKTKGAKIPPKPEDYIPYAPLFSGEFTKASLYENTKKGFPTLVFASEADTITSSNASQFGGYTSMVRSLFHEGELSKSTKQDGFFHSHAQIAFNVTGTEGQLPDFLGKNGIENGFYNRFLYYALPDTTNDFVFTTPEAGDGKTISDEITNLASEEMLRMYLYCREKEPLTFAYTKDQIAENTRFWRQEIEFLKKNYEISTEIVNSLSTRYSLMQARICSLFMFLDTYNSKNYREQQRQNKLGTCQFPVDMATFAASQVIMQKAVRAAVEVAIWVLDETDNNTRFRAPKVNSRQEKTLLFASLPSTQIGFSQDDVIQKSEEKELSYSTSTIRAFVKKWEKEGKIKLVGKAKGGKKLYKKV